MPNGTRDMGGLEAMGLKMSMREAKRSFSVTGGGVSGDGTTGVPARGTTVVELRRARGGWRGVVNSWSMNHEEMKICTCKAGLGQTERLGIYYT